MPRIRLLTVAASLFLFSGAVLCAQPKPVKETAAMRVEGRFLYTAWGEKIVLRGVNHGFIWVDPEGVSLPEIARTGANSVRIVWQTSGAPSGLDRLILKCIQQKMIPIVELHDATGDLKKVGQCVDYWTQPEVVKIIARHQKYLLVNIANEPGDGSVTKDQFLAACTDAVNRMRRAGIRVPLLIDPSDWGKDFRMIKACAAELIAADPERNLMFDLHMWWPAEWGYGADSVRDALKESVDMNIPFIVGEFGNVWDETEAGKIPYPVILEECQKNEIGWLAWSWGPGNQPQTWLDMTADGTFASLKGWGLEVAVTSPFGIQTTSRKPPSLEKILQKGVVPKPLPVK
jgi:mannan endo-1,4-beta-mannosidase